MPRLSRHARQQLLELPATLQTVDTSPARCAVAMTLPTDERAKLFLALMRRDGLSQMETATRCGTTSSTVLRTLRAAGHVTTKELHRLRRFVETGQRAARAGLTEQMRYADGVLRMGEGDAANRVLRQAARAGRAFFEAHVRALPPEGIAGRRCLAFAGIGDPGKFFDTVAAVGGEVAVAKSFGDHHFYSEFDAQDLLSTADAQGLEIVTTAKDAVRLDHGGEAMAELKRRAKVIEIEAVFDIASAPRAIVAETVEAWRRRRLEK